ATPGSRSRTADTWWNAPTTTEPGNTAAACSAALPSATVSAWTPPASNPSGFTQSMTILPASGSASEASSSRWPSHGTATITQIQMAERFLALHRQQQPLLLPNPWDLGSAKLLAWLGFSALATTSGGFAATVGRLDGKVRRDEALAHAAAIVEATDLPVSAD